MNRDTQDMQDTAVFICSEIRVIGTVDAGSAGLFARPILIQVLSAVISCSLSISLSILCLALERSP